LKNEVTELKLNVQNSYKNIFGNNIEKMKTTITLLDLAMKKREELLENKAKQIRID